MLSVVKKQLKREVSGHALNSHGDYIVYHGKSWKNHGIMLLNFCGNPENTPPGFTVKCWLSALEITKCMSK